MELKSSVKVICTIGPGSNKPEILRALKDRGASFFRINLSHTPEEEIEQRVKDLSGYGVPVILDTEGNQVRSGNTNEIDFEEGSTVKIFNRQVECDSENLFLTPLGVMYELEEGDLVSIDFDSLLLRVVDTSNKSQGYVTCKVVISGSIGGRKAAHIDSPTFSLPPFSIKDHRAIEIGKQYGVTHFTLSFMEYPGAVEKFRQKYPGAKLYSKIESKKGFDNYLDIAKVSDGVLIDRGDLSTQVEFEKIPFVQKIIARDVSQMGKEVFVATNTLEQMATSLKPSKAEVNDIVNTILDGATGIALTKETAVGKHPIETVNVLKNIISQVDFVNTSQSNSFLDKIKDVNYFYSKLRPQTLTKPHGGELVDLFDPKFRGQLPGKSIEIDENTLMDVEQIAVGVFSPLKGFMNKEEFSSVADTLRLPNGVVWPIPVYLDIDQQKKQELSVGESVVLTNSGENYAILKINDIYEVDKEDSARKLFGTLSLDHPGVSQFMSTKDYFVGGEVLLLRRRSSKYKVHELTPKQTRRIFSERGWKNVIGFHTRNVIHRSHEFIQMEGMKRSMADGLFVHPVIGKKKKGDFESEVIINAYEKMISEIYPKSKVVLGTFATYSRYAGPREALFTALCRKNFGCSHFIVGRDHTGVGNYYHPNASHKIFDSFTYDEIGIVPVKFDKVFYSSLSSKYLHEPEFIDHPEEYKLHISGTQARDIFQRGEFPPRWFMRPEIAQTIIDLKNKGNKIFVE